MSVFKRYLFSAVCPKAILRGFEPFGKPWMPAAGEKTVG